jgi:hypothetical protein
MNHIDNRSHVVYRSMLQNAMTEIEDVTGATLGAAQYVMNPLFNFWSRCKEQSRIKISLHGHVVSEQSPAVVQWDAPVKADHISAGPLH